jgi:hypothetical protein
VSARPIRARSRARRCLAAGRARTAAGLAALARPPDAPPEQRARARWMAEDAAREPRGTCGVRARQIWGALLTAAGAGLPHVRTRRQPRNSPPLCGDTSPQGNARTCLEHRTIAEGWATPTSRATCGSRSASWSAGIGGARVAVLCRSEARWSRARWCVGVARCLWDRA